VIAAVAVLGATPLGRALALHLDAAGALATLWDAEPAALVGSTWPTATDLAGVLANPEIDAVALTGPLGTRAALAEAAARAGKHVLVPGALDADGAGLAAARAAAEGAGRLLVVADPVHWRAATRAAASAVAGLGPVREAELIWRTAGPAEPGVALAVLTDLLGGADTVQVLHHVAHVTAGAARGVAIAVGEHPAPGLHADVVCEGGAVRVEGATVTVHHAGLVEHHSHPADGLAALCQAFLTGAVEARADGPLLAAARAATARSTARSPSARARASGTSASCWGPSPSARGVAWARTSSSSAA
jgi:predicted dehydrogenase